MTLQQNSVVQSRRVAERAQSFDDEFAALFKVQYPRIYRYLDRMSGDPDAAEDLAQETFVRLYQRRSMPDEPSAWLISVGLNLLRNMASSTRRRIELLESNRSEHDSSTGFESAEDATQTHETQARVRRAIDSMDERDKSLLLLRADGYSYKELAAALHLNVASIGTLMARAQRSFRSIYEESGHAR
ncbi:MAG: sigma-70 family RNA polymerase sigma factor [Gemmatimonadales bacterium]